MKHGREYVMYSAMLWINCIRVWSNKYKRRSDTLLDITFLFIITWCHCVDHEQRLNYYYFCLSYSSVQGVWRCSLRSQHREVSSVSGTCPAHHPAARPVAQRRWRHGNTARPHAFCTVQWTPAEDWHTAGNNTHTNRPCRTHLVI